jgi:alanine racemase
MPTSDAAAVAGPPHAAATLTIDLDAIAANFHLLAKMAAPAACAAVVKSDAYGLGMAPVVDRLHREGCGLFFVATLDEAIALRARFDTVEIVVFNGLLPEEAADYRAHDIHPTLNDLGQIADWAGHCVERGPLPAAIHVDTGMSRLGLSKAEANTLLAEPERLMGFKTRYLLSHLACADTPDHPLNREQRAAFGEIARHFPETIASLAASSGIFLGREWHFGLVRPGVALYGGAPIADSENPMLPVVRLQAKVLQLRDVDSPETVGYGATHRFSGRRRLATIAAGYADGYLRGLSGRATAYAGDIALPLVGRVSMDLITLDVTAAPDLKTGGMVDLIGPRYGIDALAADADTIGYEILTGLGPRYRRQYIEGAA